MADQKLSPTKTATPSAARAPSSFTDQLIEPLSRLRGEVDRLFEDFPFRMPTIRFPGALAAMAPALEMTETKKAYKISAELPGIDPEQVEVSVDNGLLRIAGEKSEEQESDEQGRRFSERRYGAFERVLSLPDDARADGIKARCRHGVLTVTIPRNEEAPKSARRIAVEKA